jgi:hypothetical protein
MATRARAKEGTRAIWELGQVQIYDGGSDGDADTAAGNTLFAVPGLSCPRRLRLLELGSQYESGSGGVGSPRGVRQAPSSEEAS